MIDAITYACTSQNISVQKASSIYVWTAALYPSDLRGSLRNIVDRGIYMGQNTVNIHSDNDLSHIPGAKVFSTLQWHHNGRDSVSNHQPHDCLLNPLFRRRSKKTSKLRVTGICAGNSPGTGELPAQMASYAENVSILSANDGHFVSASIYSLRPLWHSLPTVSSYEIELP